MNDTARVDFLVERVPECRELVDIPSVWSVWWSHLLMSQKARIINKIAKGNRQKLRELCNEFDRQWKYINPGIQQLIVSAYKEIQCS